MEKKTKKLIISVISSLLLLLIVIGATYAFFMAEGGEAVSKDIHVEAGTTNSMSFNIDNEIYLSLNAENLAEGKGNVSSNQVTATAIATAGSDVNVYQDYYYLYILINKNEFIHTTDTKEAELVLNVEGPNGLVTKIPGLKYIEGKGFDITEKTGIYAIASNYMIEATRNGESSNIASQDWKVTISFINLNSSQNANAGKIFDGSLFMQREKFNMPLATFIKNTYTNQGINGLYYHNGELENSANDNSYRYAGSNPNNYVCFGYDDSTNTYNDNWCPDDNLYRIIGIYGDNVKLIKAYEANENVLGVPSQGNASKNNTYYKGKFTNVPGYAWSGSKDVNSNEWPTSVLNTEILNNEEQNYLHNLGSTWTDKIISTDWHVGGNHYFKVKDVTAATSYQNEYVSPVNNVNVNKKIGLLYINEYGFATLPKYWTTNLNAGGYNQEEIKTNNWLYFGIDEATITRNASNGLEIYYVGTGGDIYNMNSNYIYAIRPTFYLNSDVLYNGGSGLESDPYRIG